MFIPNDNTQNYPFCRLQLVDVKLLDIILFNQPIRIQFKVPNVGKPMKKKMVLQNFGD